MGIQLYRQLLQLDLTNDHLLQLYYVLYYALPEEEKFTRERVQYLINTREKIKPELRKHIGIVKEKTEKSRLLSMIAAYLPILSKLIYMVKEIFSFSNWKACDEKEQQNLNLYARALYNQKLCPLIVSVLMEQKEKLESYQIENR